MAIGRLGSDVATDAGLQILEAGETPGFQEGALRWAALDLVRVALIPDIKFGLGLARFG